MRLFTFGGGCGIFFETAVLTNILLLAYSRVSNNWGVAIIGRVESVWKISRMRSWDKRGGWKYVWHGNSHEASFQKMGQPVRMGVAGTSKCKESVYWTHEESGGLRALLSPCPLHWLKCS